MYTVKQSTTLTVPMFVHDANGDAVTGLVNAGFTKRISKGSGAFAAMTVTIAEMENGWYSIPLSATHTDTLGLLTLTFTHGSSKQINLQFRVEAKLIDDLNDIAASAIVSGGAIDTTGGAVDTVTSNSDMRGTDGAYTGTPPTVIAIRQEIDSNSTQLAAILADTASMGITKNAAFSNFEFPMVLTSDHYTAATGLTVTGERSIDGGAFASISGTIAEVGSGVYQCDLLAADTNGDVITYKFSSGTADDTIITITTRA